MYCTVSAKKFLTDFVLGALTHWLLKNVLTTNKAV